jgi:hypothetical protein
MEKTVTIKSIAGAEIIPTVIKRNQKEICSCVGVTWFEVIAIKRASEKTFSLRLDILFGVALGAVESESTVEACTGT